MDITPLHAARVRGLESESDDVLAAAQPSPNAISGDACPVADRKWRAVVEMVVEEDEPDFCR